MQIVKSALVSPTYLSANSVQSVLTPAAQVLTLYSTVGIASNQVLASTDNYVIN